MKILILLFVTALSITMAGCVQGKIQRPTSYNYTHGIDLANDGKDLEALDCFENELKDNPQNGYAYSWIAVIYIRHQEYGMALNAVRNSIKYLPAKDEDFMTGSYKALSTIYLSMEDTIRAYSALADGLKNFSTNEDLLEMRAQLYFEQERYEDSNKDYQLMVKSNPGGVLGHMGIGRNLKMQKRYVEAIAYFDKVIRLAPNYSSGYAFRAECNIAQKKYDKATEDIIKSLSIDINDQKAFHHLIELSDSAYDDVISHLQVETIKDKNTINWYYCLGRVAEQAGHFQQAINYYENGIQVDAASILEERIAKCYQKLQDFDNAILHIDKAYNLDNEDETLLVDKAEIFADAYKYTDAIDVITKVIETNSDYDIGYSLRASYKERMKDYKGAIEDLSVAVILDPRAMTYYSFRGYLYSKIGENFKAERDYRKILESDTIVNSSSVAMYAYQALGENKKAEEFMSAIIANDSTNSGIYYDAACLYGRIGDLKKSISYLRQSFEKGYKDYLRILQDYDMDILRELPEFQNLIEEFFPQRIITTSSTHSQENKEKVAVKIPFSKENKLCKVQCTINGINLHFVFDTGASVVSISDVEATFMLKNGYITKDDIIGRSNYMTASGKIEEGTVINIKRVNFGGLSLENIRASVAKNQHAPLLLGQSVLGRLGKIEIDNKNQVILISNE